MTDKSKDTTEVTEPTVVELTPEEQAAKDLLELKNTCEYVCNVMDKFKEPGVQHLYIRDELKKAHEANRADTDLEFRKVLYSIGANFPFRLSKETSNDPAYIRGIGELLDILIRLFTHELKQGRYEKTYVAGMTYLFQHDCLLHKRHFQISDDEMRKMATKTQLWRQDLKTGDMIDVLVYADPRLSHKGYMQGTITEVDEDLLSVQFLDSASFYDGRFDRYALEIQQFETKTKDDYAWKRENLKAGFQCDAHDQFSWCKATILKVNIIKVAEGRTYESAVIGYRIYKPDDGPNAKSDEMGTYEGWSSKQDEAIPVISPRIVPFLTKYKKANDDSDDEIEEDYDDNILPEPGMTEVYAVPRPWKCPSSAYIHCMNLFGNLGGFACILKLITEAEMVTDSSEKDKEGLDVSMMGMLAQCITLPHAVFHRKFIKENGVKIAEAVKERLLKASDKSLRDIRKQQIDSILNSVDNICGRFMEKPARKKNHEQLKLQLALKSIASEYIEPRINAMKDLNILIKNNTMYNVNKNFSSEFLIEWILQNGLLDIIWDPRKTHLQLVQRSNDIFRLLAREKKLDETITKKVMDLVQYPEYKIEALKFITESSYLLETEQKEFFTRQIAATPVDQLKNCDFEAVCDLSKGSASKDFNDFVFNFFFNCIQSEDIDEELQEIAIQKCADSIKFQDLAKKQVTFERLVECLKQSTTGTLPILRLFKQLIKDQKDRSTYKVSSNSTNNNVKSWKNASSNGVTHISYSGNLNSGNSAMIQDNKDDDDDIYNSPTADKTAAEATAEEGKEVEVEKEKELTLAGVVESLQDNHQLMDNLLSNLANYFKIIGEKTEKDQANLDRSIIFVCNPRFHHQSEVEERLQFIQEIVSAATFSISKVQLKVIYDLLSSSPIASDQKYFLEWCRKACQSAKQGSATLDMVETGVFLSELIADKTLDLERLPLVGFQFIQDYFISLNADGENPKLKKIPPPLKKAKVQQNQGWNNNFYFGNQKQEEKEDKPKEEFTPHVLVQCEPHTLDQIELIWTIALTSLDSDVTEKASNLLVMLMINVEDLKQSAQIMKNFIDRCLSQVEGNQSAQFVSRTCYLLQKLIKESEKKGTNGVTAHNTILNGECLDRLIIKNSTGKHKAHITVRCFTSATVWEFIQEVSYMLDLSPKYCKFILPNGTEITDEDHGKIMEQLGLKNGDVLEAKRTNKDEVVEMRPIHDAELNIDPQAMVIFNFVYDLYTIKDSEGNEYMTPETCVHFIRGCTGETCTSTDSRIEGLFQQYNKGKDQKLLREELITFFHNAAKGKPDRVFENLKLHNVRLDLQRLCDITYENNLSKYDMPRYTMSDQEGIFNSIINLLDRNDSSSMDVWELVRMLSTNKSMFTKVLNVEELRDGTGKIQWADLLDNKNVYRKIYSFEIIEALLQQTEVFDDNKRIEFVSQQKPMVMGRWKNPIFMRPVHHGGLGAISLTSNPSVGGHFVDFNNMANKDKWMTAFIEEGGFQYVVTALLNYDMSRVGKDGNKREFDLKDLSFLMTLMKIFLLAAFEAESEQQFDLPMTRKNSNVEEGEVENKSESQFKTRLRSLMDGQGKIIIEGIDLVSLQSKLLQVISTMLAVQEEKKEIVDEKAIVDSALSIWMGCLIYDQTLFESFLTFESFHEQIANPQDFIMNGILYCPVEKIRQSFRNVLSTLTTRIEAGDAVNFLLELLSSKFSMISEYSCLQFFGLFNDIVDIFFKNASEQQQDAFDAETLLGQIIDKINLDTVDKKSEGGEDSDEDEDLQKQEAAVERERLSVGLIKLADKIISKVKISVSEKIVEKKDLVNRIFKNFLFASIFQKSEEKPEEKRLVQRVHSRKLGGGAAAGASNKESREAGYALLNSLIKKSSPLMNSFIIQQLMPLMELIKKPQGWKYAPTSGAGDMQKYVGLANLGAICYMNSMNQLFFMIPAFRYNLLSVDDGKDSNLQKCRKGTMIDDNVLHQFQHVVANLELSTRHAYNPYDYCFSFKEDGNNPTNTGEQKDAQEYLNFFMDRIERGLKDTRHKYLVQSIFGGKTVSQMKCPECGFVKDRLEDFSNKTLTVKDFKSVEESLKAEVQGEKIDDYKCSGCNKKVEVTKRTLFAETPNVLILHLQRLVFNFDTFQNDKLNSYFEFPTVLDLKPYSYHEVMKKEGTKVGEAEGSAPKVEVQKEKGAEEEEQEIPPVIIEDDCWEYKLVGINMHSGSANMGHYWSYCNTERGNAEGENSMEWMQTTEDPWQEFNDMSVSDWTIKDKLKDDCFGDENPRMSWSGMGKSAYMLFYERRMKKPLKVLIPQAPKAEMKEGAEDDLEMETEEIEPLKLTKTKSLLVDPVTNEHYKMIPYHLGIDECPPNEIYNKVAEDNLKFTFETDVYSEQFFQFIRGILESVAELGKTSNGENLLEVRQNAMIVAQKALFDILAHCRDNSGMKPTVEVMIDVFSQDMDLCINFLTSMMDEENNDNMVFELLLDNTECGSRLQISHLFKWLLAHVKLFEKDLILNGTTEEIEKKTYDELGQENGTDKFTQPASVAVRFMNQMINQLNFRVAKSWARFDEFIEMVLSFGVYTPEHIYAKGPGFTNEEFDKDSDSFEIGMTYFFRENMIQRIGDFILGNKSPFLAEGEQRANMGGQYSQPEFTHIMKLFNLMMQLPEYLEKFPLSEQAQDMFTKKEMLKNLMEPNESGQMSPMIIKMCTGNLKMTKKVSSQILKSFQNANFADPAKTTFNLNALQQFMKIDDGLKRHRIEWLFGLPEIVVQKSYSSTKGYSIQLQNCEKINKEAHIYRSSIIKGNMDESFLTRVTGCRGSANAFCVKGITFLVQMCLDDPDVARYVYEMPGDNLAISRMTDWWLPYMDEQRVDVMQDINKGYKGSSVIDKHESIQKYVTIIEEWKVIMNAFVQEDRDKLEDRLANGFPNCRDIWMQGTNDEVMDDPVPQIIIGKQVSEPTVIDTYEDDQVEVTLQELECEWNYSNPTGFFNLSCPEKPRQVANFNTLSYTNFRNNQHRSAYREAREEKKAIRLAAKAAELEAAGKTEEEAEAEESSEEDIPELELDTRPWLQHKQVGVVLLRVEVKNKSSSMQQINVTLTRESPEEPTNLKHLSTVPYFKKCFMRQSDCVCHIVKVDPSKPFDKLTMKVEGANSVAAAYQGGGGNQGGSNYQPMRIIHNGGGNSNVMNLVEALSNQGGNSQLFQMIQGNSGYQQNYVGGDSDGDMDEDIDSNEGVGGQEGDNDSPYGNNDDIDDP